MQTEKGKGEHDQWRSPIAYSQENETQVSGDGKDEYRMMKLVLRGVHLMEMVSSACDLTFLYSKM